MGGSYGGKKNTGVYAQEGVGGSTMCDCGGLGEFIGAPKEGPIKHLTHDYPDGARQLRRLAAVRPGATCAC